MEMRAAAMLEIMVGMKKGETRPGPLVKYFSNSSQKVSIPPMPEPTMVPKR